MSTSIRSHVVMRRRPARLLARCAVVALILAAVGASRFDPIPRVQPRRCATATGSCSLFGGPLATMSRGVA